MTVTNTAVLYIIYYLQIPATRTLIFLPEICTQKAIFKPWLSGCAEPGGTSTDSAFVADSASSWFARGEFGHVNVGRKGDG